MIQSFQVRAARALLGLSQAELAKSAGVGVATIQRLESESGTADARGTVQTLVRVQKALEASGVLFIDDDGQHGPGVRLKKTLNREGA